MNILKRFSLHYLFQFVTCILLFSAPCFSVLVNLEDNVQDFVLETYRISIPGIPNAFNPSIIRWKNSLVMTFREYDPLTNSATHVYIALVDDNFQLISVPQRLLIIETSPIVKSWPQDPRLIVIKDELYLIYNNFVLVNNGQNRRMNIAKLHYDELLFTLDSPQPLTSFDRQNPKKQEKNWSPFDFQGNLLLTYSIFPHHIYFPSGKGHCHSIATTTAPNNWNWGEPRGGTQGQLVNGQYLSFFHSCKDMTTVHSNGECMIHYFMGAYTFSALPPFSITSFSHEPIVGKGFYEGPAYKTWKPLRVVFPGGFIFDDHYIWIVYGRQDHECWVIKLDKTALLHSLIPTSLEKNNRVTT